jgi:steroid 5-alpha reductase family enzyme
LLEVISDQQKRTFRKNPENLDKFIVHGLWAWSRHPNYFGEILLWFGIAIIALPTLEGWRYITLISPLFVYLLLTRVSGLPMLESAANKKWGDNPKYLSYKKNTPLLVLRKPKNSERLIGNKIVF